MIAGATDEPPRGSTEAARVGVLMLDTRFPCPPGDVGNPATFDFPLRYHRVPAASPARVVLTAILFLPGEGEGVDARDCESGGRPLTWDRADSPKR